MKETRTNFKKLEEAIAEIKTANPRMGGYVQVSLDTADNTILTNYHVSLGHNSYTQYDDPNIIRVANFDQPITATDLETILLNSLTEHNNHKAYMDSFEETTI